MQEDSNISWSLACYLAQLEEVCTPEAGFEKGVNAFFVEVLGAVPADHRSCCRASFT